jgi:hypothetical protein
MATIREEFEKMDRLGRPEDEDEDEYEDEDAMFSEMREAVKEQVTKVFEMKDPGFAKSARKFMLDCGLKPTSDAVEQLVDVFLPCLKIMCNRGYDPEGKTWKKEGWRGMLWKIRDKADRLWYRGWKRGQFDYDSPLDLINYAGFYYRLHNEGDPWGERGAPGSSEMD